MPVRALFSSFLLAVILATGITATANAAPKAKIALGAKKHKKQPAKKAAKRVRVKSSAARRVQPAVLAPPAPAECAHTAQVPTAENLELIRAAIVCLHNRVRAQRGLTTLAENAKLAAAAAGHSADMVAHRFFDHTTPAGGTFVQRVIGAGYARAEEGWTLGENLAWGTGEHATPAGMVNAWMNSPGHRENLLKGAYREIGIGIRLGTPTGAAEGATVSVEFGARA